MKGKWDDENIEAAYNAIELVGTKFASSRGLGETASFAFSAVYNQMTLQWEGGAGTCGDAKNVASGGCTDSANKIRFWSLSGHGQNDISRMIKTVVHELGHAYNATLNSISNDLPLDTRTIRNQVLRPNMADGQLSPNHYDWQQHPPAMDEAGWSKSETFADIFIAWTYGAWNTDNNPQVVANINTANDWMNGLIP